MMTSAPSKSFVDVQPASTSAPVSVMRLSSLSVLLMLQLVAVALLSSLPIAWGQGSTASSATVVVNGQQLSAVIDAFEYQQVTQYFRFTIPPSSPALQRTSDLMLSCLGFGSQEPAYLGLLVTDPTGAQYSDSYYYAYSYYGVSSTQITSNSSVLQTGQQLYAGDYLIQVTAESAGYPYLGGDTWYQFSVLLQPRTLLTPAVPTPLALSTPDASFPAGAFAHADVLVTSEAFYLIVTTASSEPSVTAPWVFWLPASYDADVNLDSLLLGEDWLDYSATAQAPYQLFWFAGDYCGYYYDGYYPSNHSAPLCYEHFTLFSQSSVFSPIMQVLPTSDSPPVTTLVPGTPAAFSATLQQLLWFSFTVSQAQVQLTLTLSSTSAAGNADLFVAPAAAVSAPFVDQVSAVWRANSSSGAETLTVLPSDPYYSSYAVNDPAHPGRQVSMAGQYFITVFTLQPGSFSLSLTLLDLTNLSAPLLDLEQGSIAAVSGSLSLGSSISYYRFQVPQTVDLNSTDLVLALSSSCADVFLSDIIATPGPSSPYSQVYSSVQTGDDVLVLSSGSYGELHSGWYWAGVASQPSASLPCNFSLAVYFDLRAQLTAGEGAQQGAALPVGGIRYYDYYAESNAVISCRVLVAAGSSPVSLYATSEYNSASPARPQYADPSPSSPSTYSYSGQSNGSLPVLSVVVGYWGSADATFCYAPGGCWLTVAVFAPVGLAGYSIEVQPFTARLVTLNDSQPAVLSLGLDESVDLSYQLSHASDCSVQLQLLSYAVPDSLAVLLCIWMPQGQVAVAENDGAFGCNWQLLVEPGVASAATLSFSPFSPLVTGALPGFNNVNGSSMTGRYSLLAMSFLPGSQSQAEQAAAANASAGFSVTQSCQPSTAQRPPIVNAPLEPSVPLTQVVSTGVSVYYVLDLSAVPITDSTDVSVYVTMQKMRSSSDYSPLTQLAYSQTLQYPVVTNGGSSVRSSSAQVQLLLNTANTANLSSSPLYLRLLPQQSYDYYGSEAAVSLQVTVLATITQRVSLLSSDQSLSFPASPSAPFRWFTLLVPTLSNDTSAVFSIAPANATAAPAMLVLQSPTGDPVMTSGGVDWSRALGTANAVAYTAGGPIIFNNASCAAQDGSCRYSVLVYTPSATAYTLMISGAEDYAPPAPVAALTIDTPVTGSLPAAGTAFYAFTVSVPAGVVNLTLSVSGGVADMFVGQATAGEQASFTDLSLGSQDAAQWWTSGSAAVKLVGFDSSSLQWTLEGQYVVTVFAQSDCSYSLQLSVTAYAPPNVTVTPLVNKQQLSSAVAESGLSVYSFQMDASYGVNSDVVVLLMPNIALTQPLAEDYLQISVSTAWPFVSSYWTSHVSDVPSTPLAVTLNADAGSECGSCPAYDPLLNQTLYITVAPVYGYANGEFNGGAYFLTVTYAARVALRPASPSHTSSSPLAVNTVQTFSYLPASANVSPANLYGAVSTLSNAPGIAALFSSYPGSGTSGVIPFNFWSSPGASSTFSSVSVQAVYVNAYCGYEAYYSPKLCVWYFQVLALQELSGFTFTVTDQPPSSSIIPGVPTAVSLKGAGCAELTFSVPYAHALSNLTFSASPSPSSGLQLFLVDGQLLPFDYYYSPDADTSAWSAADISSQPLLITPNNSLFQTYSNEAGISGPWFAVVCAQLTTTAAVTVTVTDPLSSSPVQAVVNGSAVAGRVAGGSSFLAFVQVYSVNSSAWLRLQLSSSASSLVLYASPSFYPGPTSLVPYANFSLSAYETSVRFSKTASGYPPLTLSRVVGTGKIRLTPATTFYLAVYNTATAAAAFTLSATGRGVNLVTPPAPVVSSSSSSSSAAAASSAVSASSSSFSLPRTATVSSGSPSSSTGTGVTAASSSSFSSFPSSSSSLSQPSSSSSSPSSGSSSQLLSSTATAASSPASSSSPRFLSPSSSSPLLSTSPASGSSSPPASSTAAPSSASSPSSQSPSSSLLPTSASVSSPSAFPVLSSSTSTGVATSSASSGALSTSPSSSFSSSSSAAASSSSPSAPSYLSSSSSPPSSSSVSSVPAAPSSSSSGLSRGALIGAIVGPVVAVLLLCCCLLAACLLLRGSRQDKEDKQVQEAAAGGEAALETNSEDSTLSARKPADLQEVEMQERKEPEDSRASLDVRHTDGAEAEGGMETAEQEESKQG